MNNQFQPGDYVRVLPKYAQAGKELSPKEVYGVATSTGDTLQLRGREAWRFLSYRFARVTLDDFPVGSRVRIRKAWLSVGYTTGHTGTVVRHGASTVGVAFDHWDADSWMREDAVCVCLHELDYEYTVDNQPQPERPINPAFYTVLEDGRVWSPHSFLTQAAAREYVQTSKAVLGSCWSIIACREIAAYSVQPQLVEVQA